MIYNKLDVSIDYFNRRTEDLLIAPQTSGILGGSAPGSGAPTVNAGSVENKGLELSLSYRKTVSEDFKYNFSFNATALKNEVLEVNGESSFLAGGSFGIGQEAPARMEAGLPIGYFRGYQTDGIFQNQGEIDAHASQSNAQPGDLRFVDIDGDGEINFSNNSDKTNLGSPIPKFMFGSVLGFNLFGLDISANLYASLGHKIVRNYERQQPYANQLDYVLDRWTVDNPSNDVPVVTTSITRNGVFSDFYVENGSYLRLRNIQVGYLLPKKLCEKFGTDYVRFWYTIS